MEIKQAVVGYGGADKNQVQQMVRALLGLPDIPRPDDAADALATAICHLHSARLKQLYDKTEDAMIASLHGRVLEVYTDSAVVEVGGVGLQVFLPAPVRDHLRSGESVFLHTYLVVRQDALALYGFDSKESRDLFVLFLSVNGVGPRLAWRCSHLYRRMLSGGRCSTNRRMSLAACQEWAKRPLKRILLQLQDRCHPWGRWRRFL